MVPKPDIKPQQLQTKVTLKIDNSGSVALQQRAAWNNLWSKIAQQVNDEVLSKQQSYEPVDTIKEQDGAHKEIKDAD